MTTAPDIRLVDRQRAAKCGLHAINNMLMFADGLAPRRLSPTKSAVLEVVAYTLQTEWNVDVPFCTADGNYSTAVLVKYLRDYKKLNVRGPYGDSVFPEEPRYFDGVRAMLVLFRDHYTVFVRRGPNGDIWFVNSIGPTVKYVGNRWEDVRAFIPREFGITRPLQMQQVYYIDVRAGDTVRASPSADASPSERSSPNNLRGRNRVGVASSPKKPNNVFFGVSSNKGPDRDRKQGRNGNRVGVGVASNK
eukprot:1194258-Prorocentrum_minimum.AAC.1